MALITAVLIVALATILAINVTFRGMVDQRRSANLFALDQATRSRSAPKRGRPTSCARMRRSRRPIISVKPGRKPLPPLPVDEGIGVVEGRLEDMQGRFNLNSLVFARRHDRTRRPSSSSNASSRMLEIEPTWATAIADWVDADVQPGFPDGAEDSVYTGQDPPHLAANMPITRVERTDGAARLRR